MESFFLIKRWQITLIKANLASSSLYVIDCFKLTKMNNEDLHGVCFFFFWLISKSKL